MEEEEGNISLSLSIGRGHQDEDEQTGGGNAPRKKLRLTEEQFDMLENSFRENNILNGNQKQELARRLDLQVRQVEVWFQNRRARTKSKKTEVECESLKRCCQSLNEENMRLKKELQSIEALKAANKEL